jgi:hypothetical protein
MPKLSGMSGFLDPIRQKMVAATPEEGVRQALVEWLIREKGVPRHLMETECGLNRIKPGAKGRVDLLVHGFRQGRKVNRPWLLAECKRPGETDWALLEVQVNRYLKIVQPEYLLLAIGADVRIFQMQTGTPQSPSIQPILDLPSFNLD